MTLTLPDTAALGDAGHITDHNLITAALADLDARGSGLDLIATAALSGASVSINGCFTTDYDTYKVLISHGYGSSGGNLLMRLRAAGSDASAGNYNYETLQGYLATAPYAGNYASRTSMRLGSVGTAVGTGVYVSADFFGPKLAQPTAVIAQHNANPAAPIVEHWHGFLNDSSAYDGLTVYPSDGPWSGGTIKIFGYRNSL